MKIKEPKTFDEQIAILKSRNLKIDNPESAKAFLCNINYYRFTAYLINYKIDKENYRDGTNFETIKSIYLFDQELRHLISSMLEVIELSFRTYIAYTLAHTIGPLGYLDYKNFLDSSVLEKKNTSEEKNRYINKMQHTHTKLINKINDSIYSNKRKTFIKHHKIKYNNQYPIWVLVEILTFGTLSKLYSIMTLDQKKKIEVLCPVKNNLVGQWLYTLSNLRNECAHFGRLYGVNNLMDITIENKHKIKSGKNKINKYCPNKLFSHLLACRELIYSRDIWNKFLSDLNSLIDKYKYIIDLNEIDFPEDWFSILSK